MCGEKNEVDLHAEWYNLFLTSAKEFVRTNNRGRGLYVHGEGHAAFIVIVEEPSHKRRKKEKKEERGGGTL